MYEELEPVVRLRIGRTIDRIVNERQLKMVEIGADFARRGLSRSGPFEAAKIKLLLQSAEEMCREVANTWRDLIVRKDGKLSQNSVPFIMQRVEEYAHAQDRNIPPAMGTRGGVMPPDWIRNQVANGINSIIAGIRRDLEIDWREHSLFPVQQSISKAEAFIIMSAQTELDSLFKEGIAPSVQANGLAPFLMIEREPSASILNEILSRIETAKLIVADLTFERPNCYYEVGYAQAKGKKVIFTAREDHDPRRPNRQPNGPKVHFDLDSHRISFWRQDALTELRLELTQRIEEAVRGLEASVTTHDRLGEKGESEMLGYFREVQSGKPGTIVLYDHSVSQGLGWPLDEVRLVLKRLAEKEWIEPFAGGYSLKKR
jgi:nucleoside 2-deoxyribosyltransferase